MSKCKPENIAEVIEYFEKNRSDQDEAESFFWRMESVGWVIGRFQAPVKSWKAAAQTHMRNNRKWAAERAEKRFDKLAKEYPGSSRISAGISDADIARGAKPGESWEAARVRLMRGH